MEGARERLWIRKRWDGMVLTIRVLSMPYHGRSRQEYQYYDMGRKARGGVGFYQNDTKQITLVITDASR